MSVKKFVETEFISSDEWAVIEEKKEQLKQNVYRARVAQSVVNVYEKLGGEARMAEWADQNYTDFMKIYAKLLPPPTQPLEPEDNTRKIKHILPRTKLDD